MPGAFVTVQFFPRYRFVRGIDVVYAPYPWGARYGLQPEPRQLSDGIYAVESVPSQNLYDYVVYSRGGPVGLFAPGFAWRREAYRVWDLAVFRDVLSPIVSGDSPFLSAYDHGYSQVEFLGRCLSGPIYGVAYILMDYSGCVDAWLRVDVSLPLGQYYHFRLWGISVPADWFLATGYQFLGLAYGAPDPHSRM